MNVEERIVTTYYQVYVKIKTTLKRKEKTRICGKFQKSIFEEKSTKR